MTQNAYQAPVDKLLTYGIIEESSDWPDYLALGLAAEHVPELIRMATDPELNSSLPDSLEVWAPIHAMRALAQLRAQEAIEPLIPFLDKTDEDDSLFEELPGIFGAFGPAAVPGLLNYLDNLSQVTFARVASANDALTNIARAYPETRQVVVNQLTNELSRTDWEDSGIHGFIVSDLLDLKATESAEAIKAAFYANKVDPMIAGDWYEVREQLGLDPSVEVLGPDPQPSTRNVPFPPLGFGSPVNFGPRRKVDKKSKNKRKQEKKARKQNRKRR